MKSKDDSKDWTEKDIAKMRRKNCIKGYDVAYNNNFVTFSASDIMYIYIVDDFNLNEDDDSEDNGEVYEDHERWNGCHPSPSWPGRDGDGVMFG